MNHWKMRRAMWGLVSLEDGKLHGRPTDAGPQYQPVMFATRKAALAYRIERHLTGLVRIVRVEVSYREVHKGG